MLFPMMVSIRHYESAEKKAACSLRIFVRNAVRPCRNRLNVSYSFIVNAFGEKGEYR